MNYYDCDDLIFLLTSGAVSLPIQPGQRVSKELALFLNNAINLVEALRSLQEIAGWDDEAVTLVDDYRRLQVKPEPPRELTDAERHTVSPEQARRLFPNLSGED